MENIERRPDPAEAREALASIERAQLAVRNTPWPTWIYPVNAVLVAGMALTSLLPQHRSAALFAVAVTIICVNVTAGYRMGTPWALPTSRAFLTAVTASTLCVVAAIAVADVVERAWPIVVLAVAAAVIYLAGGVAHRASTGRPR
jgi:hypothetical protein